MDLIREARLMVTSNEQPFRFLTITLNSTASAQFCTWNGGAEIKLSKPTDNDLRAIIEACQVGLGKES